ncbi:MAG: MFS transporter [Chloroflexota bacterium]|nr:MFS transporter [Chloroflexota bacterium]
MATLAAPRPFVRDRFTWLAYLMLGYYAYLQSALGPLMPFLREELRLNYTVTGLHLSAFAVGMTIAGLTGDRAAARVGRNVVFWGGGGGMAFGALLLVLGQSPAITIPATFVMGLIGSYLLVMIQATLADHHGERRAFALTEANVIAVFCAALAPIFVGQSEQLGIGWRAALLIVAAAWLAAFAIARRTPIAESSIRTSKSHKTPRINGTLPRLFWVYWGVTFLSVAVEWSLIFWGADFLEKVVGLDRAAASTLMSVFLGAMFVGRLIGSRLTRSMDTRPLLMLAAGMVVVGFPVFWLAQTPVLNLVGLFICGLGVANLYPFTLSVVMGIAPNMANVAGSRISFASGLAILIVPQVLGSTADQIGIFSAFGIAGGFIAAAFALIVYANRAKR